MTLENESDDFDVDIPVETQPDDTTEPTPEPTPEPEAKPEAEPKPEPSKEDDEVAILRRVVASDPNLSARYEYEKFGPAPAPLWQQPQAQQPQQQPVAQKPAEPQDEPAKLPFDADDFDPTDLNHQMSLIGHVLQQSLKPFSEFIEKQNQQEVQEQQERMNTHVQQLEDGVRDLMNKDFPGFADFYKKKAVSPAEKAIVRFAHDEFSEVMKRYNPNQWGNPKVHQAVIKEISPNVKALAEKLGVFASNTEASAKEALKKEKAKESYVESSNAIPTGAGNVFDKAYKAGDIDAMFDAIGF